jgi:hypothetical protein
MIRGMHQTLVAVSAALLMQTTRSHADKTGGARPPFWAEKGAIVYRVATPDQPNVLPQIEEGTGLVSHLTDGSVRQILITNGIIGHDHPGAWNWDGVWSYWNRVTFRGGDFKTLSHFMIRVKINALNDQVELRPSAFIKAPWLRLCPAQDYKKDRIGGVSPLVRHYHGAGSKIEQIPKLYLINNSRKE